MAASSLQAQSPATPTPAPSVITELLLLGRGWPEDADRSPTEQRGRLVGNWWQRLCWCGVAGGPVLLLHPPHLQTSVSWVALSPAQPW